MIHIETVILNSGPENSYATLPEDKTHPFWMFFFGYVPSCTPQPNDGFKIHWLHFADHFLYSRFSMNFSSAQVVQLQRFAFCKRQTSASMWGLVTLILLVAMKQRGTDDTGECPMSEKEYDKKAEDSADDDIMRWQLVLLPHLLLEQGCASCYMYHSQHHWQQKMYQVHTDVHNTLHHQCCPQKTSIKSKKIYIYIFQIAIFSIKDEPFKLQAHTHYVKRFTSFHSINKLLISLVTPFTTINYNYSQRRWAIFIESF